MVGVPKNRGSPGHTVLPDLDPVSGLQTSEPKSRMRVTERRNAEVDVPPGALHDGAVDDEFRRANLIGQDCEHGQAFGLYVQPI